MKKICQYKYCNIEVNKNDKRKSFCCPEHQLLQKNETRKEQRLDPDYVRSDKTKKEIQEEAALAFIKEYGYTEKIISIPIKRKD